MDEFIGFETATTEHLPNAAAVLDRLPVRLTRAREIGARGRVLRQRGKIEA